MSPESPETPPQNTPPSSDDLPRLQKELYAREETPTIEVRRKELKDLGVRTPRTITPDTEPQRFKDVASASARRRRQLFLIGGIAGAVLLVIALGAGATYWYQVRHRVNESTIAVAVTGPAETISGQEVTYTITVGNESRVTWENVEVLVAPPKGFKISSSEPTLGGSGKQLLATLGTVEPDQRPTVTLTGRLLGEEAASLLTSAEVVITPSNFPSGRFSKTAALTTVIHGVPLEVALEAPPRLTSGERATMVIETRNVSAETLRDVYIKVQPFEGVQIAVDDPRFSPNFSAAHSGWLVPELASLASIRHTIALEVSGLTSEQRTLDVEVGIVQDTVSIVQRHVTHVMTVAATELALEQSYNNSTSRAITVASGSLVEGTISFRNNGTVDLSDTILTLTLNGIAFDAQSLKLPAGAYDTRTKTITWSSASVPELKNLRPQQTGEVHFSFKVLRADRFPKTGADSSQPAINATAAINSASSAIRGVSGEAGVRTESILSVATDGTLALDAFYDDGRLGLTSSGPLPPEVGQTTTYTVRVRAGSTLNGLEDVTIPLQLAEGVTYTGSVYKTKGDVTYNERTGEVIWKLPLIAAGTARILPAEEMHIQIAITPAPAQREQEVIVVKKLSLQGTDSFTDSAVASTVTDYPTTKTASPSKGEVK